MRAIRDTSGQAIAEHLLLYAGIMVPLTFAVIFTAELLWTWHSIVEITRVGARYAATHCWQPSAENVMNYMRAHVPPMVDRDQFTAGEVEIEVKYYSRDAASGTLVEFSCDQAECSNMCVPDTVSVRVRNYEFRHFMSYLGLPAVAMPEFPASLPIESAGCDAESGVCLP